jgi:hypothetical protein
MVNDRNTDSAGAALQGSTAYSGMGTEADGTSLRVYALGGASAEIAVLTAGTDFFWAVVQSGSGASALTGYYRTAGQTSFASQQTTGDAAIGTGPTLTVGNNTFTEWFDGRFQHIRCWDAALTSDELALEMYSALPVRLASLNFAWRDISASSVTDLGANARNATIGGTLTLEDNPPVEDLLHPWWSMNQGSAPQPSTLGYVRSNGGLMLRANSGRLLRAA